MRLWESLLRTTGGAIETSDTKTDWVQIGFEWKQGKFVYERQRHISTNDGSKSYRK